MFFPEIFPPKIAVILASRILVVTCSQIFAVSIAG